MRLLDRENVYLHPIRKADFDKEIRITMTQTFLRGMS